jgi:hypothetical protein
MRTLRGPSRTLKSLHRTVSTSDVPYRHLQAHPSRNPYPPDVLSVVTLLAEGGAELNLQARGLLLRPAGESKTGISPRTPFVVSRTCEPRPTGHANGAFKGSAHTRTVSPSIHPRSASGGATDFLLASALCHQ